MNMTEEKNLQHVLVRNSLYAPEFYTVQIFLSRKELCCLFIHRKIISQTISISVATVEGQLSPLVASNNWRETGVKSVL